MIDVIATKLGIPLSELKADINDTAWTWEILVDDNRADSQQAVRILRGLIRSYLRGRGCRMGNYQGVMKHSWTYSHLCAEVVKYVTEEGEISFSYLHALGFNSPESVVDILRAGKGKPDIMEQVEQILKNHGRREIT